MATTSSSQLDFAALLSRNHRPSRVTQLPFDRDVYKPEGNGINKKRAAAAAAAAAADRFSDPKEELRQRRLKETLALAQKLVSQTPVFARHAGTVTEDDDDESLPKSQSWKRRRNGGWMTEQLPPALHEVELGDWESKIQWGGAPVSTDDRRTKEEATTTTTSSHKTAAAEPVPSSTAAAILQRPRNPALDNLDLSTVSWGGASQMAFNKKVSRSIPLILEKGVAGRSVALQYLAPKRPTPFSQSSQFVQRYERETMQSTKVNSSAASLQMDQDKKEADIEARQRKRAQMERDKEQRVTDAMGTLAGALAGKGKGRTITSSLMGPGGTERTGRPSRQSGSSLAHDVEYVEQLDMVYNHALVKPDLSKVELRQFHRPRLTRGLVMVDRPWQFQIRATGPANAQNKPKAGVDGSTMMVSYHSSLHAGPGALSQAKIRTETDLSPSFGMLVLFEYCEERPPVQMAKGMGCRIVNYYRGDKSRVPISAGGGDRPVRKKRHAGGTTASGPSSKIERPPRLVGPSANTKVSDLIGTMHSKAKKGREGSTESGKKNEPSVDILPEGVTEILHSKVHGPFIGEVEENTTQAGLICNLFAAPMFRHEPEQSDFLMILGKKTALNQGDGGGSIGVFLRPLPSSVFCVGQVEPRFRVFALNTTPEKTFMVPFITFQIAKALTRMETKEGHGLRLDEINERLFANTPVLPNTLRQRIKQVAVYDKNTQIWTSKRIGVEDYPGVEALGRRFTPENVVANETLSAAVCRLRDLGMDDIFAGPNGVASVGVAMIYLTGQVNASRERKSKMAKMVEYARTAKSNTKAKQVALYERAAAKLEAAWKELRLKQEIARFIYEELQLSPWHLTSEFIDVHKNAQGTGMMKLTGLGDPSGLGEGFNFVREVDAKPSKGTANSDGALSAQIKKITGTENDLRKLTMKQMASLLRSYGMGHKEIDKLKRWDRVHVIRDLSTKAASDGMGDGLERYARGEKMKLSDQKQMYRERIQEIWRRQRVALSTDAGEPGRGLVHSASSVAFSENEAVAPTAAEKQLGRPAPPPPPKKEGSDSDSDSDDDDFAAEFEDALLDVRQANQLVAAHVRGDGDGPVAGLAQNIVDTQDLSKDARELAALKREREEERAAQEDILSKSSALAEASTAPRAATQSNRGRKVVRRRITKTYPDGRQTTVFKYVVMQQEVEQIVAKKEVEETMGKQDSKDGSKTKKKGSKTGKPKKEYLDDRRIVGHAMFEDDDDDVYDYGRGRIKLQVQKSTRVRSGGKGMMPKAPPKPPKLQLGKLRQKESHEKRIKKRKREIEEADLYKTVPQRRGSSNRRERGFKPHVIFAEKLESFRGMVEQRPKSGPFHKPVSRRAWPRYYEVISDPIDLQTIRLKNERYDYRTAASFLRDFELMKNNAIKFNGAVSNLGTEAASIYEFIKEKLEENKDDLTAMEEAVKEQAQGGGGRKKKKARKDAQSQQEEIDAAAMGESMGSLVVDGINLGDLSTSNLDFNFDSD